jgi:hypothetical protein
VLLKMVPSSKAALAGLADKMGSRVVHRMLVPLAVRFARESLATVVTANIGLVPAMGVKVAFEPVSCQTT